MSHEISFEMLQGYYNNLSDEKARKYYFDIS